MHFRIVSKILTITIAVTSFAISSCSPDHSKTIVAEYGSDKITLGEFEKVYAKNSGGIEIASKDSLSKLKNFLDLYVNFRMKLRDAQVRGYEQNPSLNAELSDYKEKIGISYMLEKDIMEPGIKDLYEKRKYELRVSHLMLRADEKMNEQQTEKFAEALIDSINKGANFEELVKKYSVDNYSNNAGGDMYYFTAGQISQAPEFEDAAYKTEVGKIYPKPVRTKFGYHIIKLTEKKLRVPEVKAAHILIDFKDDSSRVDSAVAFKLATDIRKQIAGGADFAELARKYSEDPGSAEKGGELGFFQRRMMIKPFDEAAFNLKPGEVSGIVKSDFGYHLIKLLETKPYGPFEAQKEELKQLFKKTRYDAAYTDYVNNLKNQYKVKVNQPVIEFVAANNDSLRFGEGYWTSDIRNKAKDSILYFIGQQAVKVDSFFNQIQQRPEYSNRLIDARSLKDAVDKETAFAVLSREAIQLDKRDQQFADLMEDYRNGIYIFKLQDEEVWGKISLDSVKLYDFYLKTKENYKWPDRVNISEIYSKSDSLINHYYSLLVKGENFDSLAKKYTERPGFKEKAGNYGFVDAKLNPLAEKAAELQTVESYSKPFKNGTGYSIVKLNAKDAARLKTFEEAKAEVSGAFQENESKRLENQYISNLKNKYHPVTYYDKLEEAFQKN